MERDPGDAVPPGVAPQTPAPLTDEDKMVKQQLELLGGDEGDELEKTPEEIDEEVERITQRVEPHSAAPSRSGISGSGSGADNEGL